MPTRECKRKTVDGDAHISDGSPSASTPPSDSEVNNLIKEQVDEMSQKIENKLLRKMRVNIKKSGNIVTTTLSSFMKLTKHHNAYPFVDNA